MHFLFCDDPLNPREPDEVYSAEYAAARAAGFSCGLVSFEGLVSGDAGFARRAGGPDGSGRVAGWYRGWMLRGEQYARLFAGMAERGIDLVVTPEAYAQAHNLPEAYPLSAGGGGVAEDGVDGGYGRGARVEACFIPAGASREKFAAVGEAFVRIRGEPLNRGLVFRAFVDVMQVGLDVASGRSHGAEGIPAVLLERAAAAGRGSR